MQCLSVDQTKMMGKINKKLQFVTRLPNVMDAISELQAKVEENNHKIHLLDSGLSWRAAKEAMAVADMVKHLPLKNSQEVRWFLGKHGQR
jgi:hypothetical protein